MNSKADFIAAMKDEKYWNERAEMLFKNIEPDEEKLIKKLVKYYKVEAERLNKLIAEYYTKYGKDNVIEYRDLLKKLSDSERKLLIEDIDEFIKKYPHHKHLKNIRTSIYKLDRLEGLKVSAELQLLELGEKEVKEVEAFLIDIYKNGYDYAQKELGFGSNFNSIDTETAKKFVNKAWVGGKSFSKRIYNNRRKVAEWIKTDFADGVKRGDSYSRLVKNLMNKFEEVSRSSAKRLVTTEASYMLNESSMAVFEKDFEEYTFNAILDSKTSKLCRRLDGEVYKVSERKAGKNFPPMHPNCRSSFNIVIPDDWMDRVIEKHYKKTKKDEFIEAKTIEEAEEYVRKTFMIECSYKGCDLEIVNAWNKALLERFSKFPKLKERFDFIGEVHERNDFIKRRYFEEEMKKLRKTFGSKFSDEYLYNEVEKYWNKISKKLSPIKDTTLARCHNYIQGGYFNFAKGITMNRDCTNDVEELKDLLKICVEEKFHPEGCVTLRASFDHEIGHQLDDLLGLSGIKEIQELFDSKTKEELKEELCSYSFDNSNKNRYSEFIAESYMEYVNNPNPRFIAKTIGQIIEYEYKRKFGE